MEVQEEEEVRHLLGDSLLACLDQEICDHRGHRPFSQFGKMIKTGYKEGLETRNKTDWQS